MRKAVPPLGSTVDKQPQQQTATPPAPVASISEWQPVDPYAIGRILSHVVRKVSCTQHTFATTICTCKLAFPYVQSTVPCNSTKAVLSMLMITSTYKDAASSSRLLCVLTPAFCPLQGLSQTCGQSLTCIRSLTALLVHHLKRCGMQNAVTAEGEKPSTSLLSSEPSDFHLPQVRGNTPGVSGAPAQ